MSDYDDDFDDVDAPGYGDDVDTGSGRVMPELVFGSVDEFVREQLRVMYRRTVGERTPRRWAADWWNYPEAVCRLDALWRSWENARLDPIAMSGWWRDHLDHHMPILMSQEGPFATAKGAAGPSEMLPCEPPPASMFPDQRRS